VAFEIALLAAFGAMLCWGIGDFLIQRAVWKVGDVEALAFIGVVGTIMLLPFAFTQLPLMFSGSNLTMLIAIGLLTFIVAITDFEALKKGKLSVIEIILELELPVTAVLAIYMLNEAVTISQLAAMSLVFAGIVLIAAKSLSLKNGLAGIEKGVLIGVAGAIGMGLLNFMTGFGAKTISPLLIIWAPWLFFTIFSLCYIWYTKTLHTFAANALKHKKLLIGMGIFDTLAWLFYAFATAAHNISIVTAITESYPAIAIMLGLTLNKEKILPHQFAGAALALGGSVVLAIMI